VTFVISRLLLVFFANSIAYSSGFYVLWTCAHAFAMHQRKVLDDNEWAGWLQWMRNCFRKGTIGEIWKQVEQDRWFNPVFQNFVPWFLLSRKINKLVCA